jgi:putative colanic acid biosynthesis acetyltransferase WcaF
MEIVNDSQLETQCPGAVDLRAYRDNRTYSYLAMRFFWSCVQLPFWPKMPKRLSPLRIFLLRLFGARIGRGCLIAGGVRVWVPRNLQMAEYCVLGDGAELYNLAPIKIGANTVISQRAYLCTATHDYTRPDFPLYSKPITIGASAWIATGTFVGPGITVGDGSVVGASAVVTRDVPPWMVCAGNPCRPIKPRRLED